MSGAGDSLVTVLGLLPRVGDSLNVTRLGQARKLIGPPQSLIAPPWGLSPSRQWQAQITQRSGWVWLMWLLVRS